VPILPPPKHPDECLYVTSSGDGWNEPKEYGCSHPDNEEGCCCEECCPYAKNDEEPPTHGDAYEAYADLKTMEALDK
jgi:hypothetical protein